MGTEDPSHALHYNPEINSQNMEHLLKPDSGAGNNSLCHWLYDTFQFAKPNLQLVILKFLPHIVGVYLSRVHLRKQLADFWCVFFLFF